MRPCSILISSWCSHDALELTIESILEHTVYDDYGIVVLDSSPENSRERQYLRRHRDDKNIRLLEYNEGRLGHGWAINKLLQSCTSELACLLDSDVEILSGDWLTTLSMLIRDDKDIGVGDMRKGGCFLNSSTFRGPLYHPSCLLLNMPVYKQFGSEDDWPERGGGFSTKPPGWAITSDEGGRIPMSEYKYRYKFENRPLGENSHLVYNFDPRMSVVHYDTAGRFTEKILWENPDELRMRSMPPDFFKNKVLHFGGMSAHCQILDGDYMRGRTALLHERLRLLRME